VPGPFDHKKRNERGLEQGAEQGQEEEGLEHQHEEPEHSRAQNQHGNATIAAMLGQNPEVGGGGIEMGQSVRRKKEDADKTVEHGGDGDAEDGGALTIDDLTSSWNPGTKRSEDRQRFLEPMPDDELPPEDADYLDAVRSVASPWELPPAWTVDGLLQPSPQVVGASLTLWAQGISRWATPSLGWRCAAALLNPPASVLQDDHGRVLHARARGGAIATWILLTSPALSSGATAPTSAFVDFCLELDGRHHRMHAVRIQADETGRRIPLSAKLLAPQLSSADGVVVPATLPPNAAAWLQATFSALLDLQNPAALVPDMNAIEAPFKEDDPLGLDAIMEQMTGGTSDGLDDPLYKVAIQAAERQAAAAARTRVRYAGLCLVIADVASLWTAGAPNKSLLGVVTQLDQDVAELLQLLVEIARAAQKKAVPPAGLKAGLTRGARRLAKLRKRADASLMAMVGGILPGVPSLPPIPSRPQDELAIALGDGEPAQALGWLDAQAPSADRTAARAFAAAAAGHEPQKLLGLLLKARSEAIEHDQIGLASVTGILLGAVHLKLGNSTECHRLAAEHLALGQGRRNGILVANAALLSMEAYVASGDMVAAQAYRVRAGNLLWRMGASGALSLLARWTPPPVEEEVEIVL